MANLDNLDLATAPDWSSVAVGVGTAIGAALSVIVRPWRWFAAKGKASPVVECAGCREVDQINRRISDITAGLSQLRSDMQHDRDQIMTLISEILEKLSVQAGDIKVCRAILDERGGHARQ